MRNLHHPFIIFHLVRTRLQLFHKKGNIRIVIIQLAKKEDIVGGTADENAIITKDILTGKEQGAKRDIVLLNAGAALYTIGKAETIKDGVKLAAEMIDSGKANEKLEQFIAYTNVK